MVNTIKSLFRKWADSLDPPIRLIVGLLAILVGFYLALHPTPLAFLFFFVGLWLIWDAIRNSGVWSAVRAFRQQDLARVRYYLALIRWPNLLNREAKSYYHWMRGVVEMSDGRLEAAKVQLLVATTGRLRTTNDRSLVQCLLAEIGLQSGDRTAARQHVAFARELAHHEQVDRIIARLERRLSEMS